MYDHAMPGRLQRHHTILRLLEQGRCTDQTTLVAALRQEGIRTTQATLSRDLKDLGVLKGPLGYQLPERDRRQERPDLHAAIRREAVSIEFGVATLVIRTRPGHANALAIVIDQAPPPDALGCIAGDDTIFLAMRTAAAARSLAASLRRLLAST